MSTNIILWGLKIYFPSAVTQDTTIGLYTSGGSSWFRWIESDLTGTSETYKSGIIKKIPPIVEDAGDLRKGGTFVHTSPMSVQVCNAAPGTATDQFWKKLDDLFANDGEGLSGLICEVIEFSKNVSTGTVTETVIAYMQTDYGDWDSRTMKIPLSPASKLRNANTASYVDLTTHPDASEEDLGKMIPMSFGRLWETYDWHAKLIRTESKNITYSLDILLNYIQENMSGDTYEIPGPSPEYHKNISSYPVVSVTGDPVTSFRVTIAMSVSGSSDMDVSPDNLYVKVTKGDNSGKIRKISRIQQYNDFELTITLQDVFEDNLVGDADGEESWVEIFEAIRTYELDSWPCGGFKDEDNNNVVYNNAPLYSYDEDSANYMVLGRYGYNVSGDADKNKLNIDPKFFVSDLDTLQSIIIKPFDNMILETKADLSDWGESGLYKTEYDGLYVRTEIAKGNLTDFQFIDVVNALSDQQYDSSHSNHLYFTTQDLNPVAGDGSDHPSLTIAWRCILPTWPENLQEIDGAYLLLYLDLYSAGGTETEIVGLTVKKSRFLGVSTLIKESTGDPSLIALNFPDEWLNRNNQNQEFFYNNDSPPSNEVNGYTQYDLNVTKKEDYLNIHDLNFLIGRYFHDNATFTRTPGVYVRELAVAFVKSQSIKKDIYCFTDGRIRNDTYGGRKIGGELIHSPIDIYEHVCRLQNWSETGVTAEAGKEYNSAAKINVSSWVIEYTGLSGTFEDGEEITGDSSGSTVQVHRDNGTDKMTIYTLLDDSVNFTNGETITGGTSGATATLSIPNGLVNSFDGMDSQRNESGQYRFAFQMFSDKNTYCDDFKNKLLKHMWCVGFINEYGEECISYIPKSANSNIITDTITYGDIPDGLSPGKMKEPKANSVYCQPRVEYFLESATGRYKRSIEIRNVHYSDYASASSASIGAGNGFDNSELENIWSICHNQLWRRYRQINDPNKSELSKLPFISNDWDAKQHLATWVIMMLCRSIPVPVYYEKAKNWHVGRHVYLQLPHQTDASSIECVIQRISKDKDNGVCSIDCLLLDRLSDLGSDYYYKDTFEPGSDEWKDTMDSGNDQYKNNI